MKIQERGEERRVINRGTVDILRIVNPYEHGTCAIYRLETDKLIEKVMKKSSKPLDSSMGLDNQRALYIGDEAINHLKELAENKNL